MAKVNSAQILISLLLICATAQGSARPVSTTKNKIIEFYIHDIFSGPNATLLHIAGPGSLTNLSFGSVGVVDDPITEGASITSKALGRMRGTFTLVSLNGFTFLFSLSAVLNTKKYNGTISIFGSRDESATVKYLPIVGGTGDFERAIGLATVVTISPLGSAIGTLHYKLDLTLPV